MAPNYTFAEPLKKRIAGNMRSFERQSLDDRELRPAGVTLVVARRDGDGGACLLLTRRSTKLRRHAGQYALPGGRLDEGETFEDAALRELEEELGLTYGPECILGALDDFQTRSGFCMRPFVIWGGSLENLRPDPVEVAIVYQIPLHDLDSPHIPSLTPTDDPRRPMIGAPIATTGQTVHAPTAALLYQFREVAMHGRPTRVAHFEQPQFAWK